jgi:hypothetical protein
MVLYRLLEFKLNPSNDQGMILLNNINESFTVHSSWLDYKDPILAIKTAIILAKRKLVERDLTSFQVDAFAVNDKLNAITKARSEIELGVRPTLELATLSKALGDLLR